MENASKALLIAASILIAIILIAVAVKTINSTQGTTDSLEQTMSATEVEMFNNKYTKFVGSNKTSSEVIALVNQLIVNNSRNERGVGIIVENTGTKYHRIVEMQNFINTLDSSKKYKIGVLIGDGVGSAGVPTNKGKDATSLKTIAGLVYRVTITIS